ncbi:MAG: GGDEF domain-containing protein [Patescibacteria group bacterium]
MLKHGLDPQLATAYSPREILSIGSAGLALAAGGVAAYLGLRNRALNKELDTFKVALYQAQQEHGKAAERSILDPLTELLNRRGLENYFEFLKTTSNADRRHDTERRSSGRRDTDPLQAKGTVMMVLDLDGFKDVNDGEGGHAAGDKTLRKVAGILAGSVRSHTDDAGDGLGRITKSGVGRNGGDEFVIILPNATGEDGLVVADRIKQNASAAREELANKRIIIPTMSIGIAEVDWSLPYSEMLTRADDALYISKTMGKDQATLYIEEPEALTG